MHWTQCVHWSAFIGQTSTTSMQPLSSAFQIGLETLGGHQMHFGSHNAMGQTNHQVSHAETPCLTLSMGKSQMSERRSCNGHHFHVHIQWWWSHLWSSPCQSDFMDDQFPSLAISQWWKHLMHHEGVLQDFTEMPHLNRNVQ